jgi:hypothetical protein
MLARQHRHYCRTVRIKQLEHSDQVNAKLRFPFPFAPLHACLPYNCIEASPLPFRPNAPAAFYIEKLPIALIKSRELFMEGQISSQYSGDGQNHSPTSFHQQAQEKRRGTVRSASDEEGNRRIGGSENGRAGSAPETKSRLGG